MVGAIAFNDRCKRTTVGVSAPIVYASAFKRGGGGGVNSSTPCVGICVCMRVCVDLSY